MRLNIDLGEHPDEPEALYSLAHVVNVACGGHAGDAASMREACRRARAHGCELAAHPSYPDRENFGRRAMDMAPEALAASVESQCAALAGIAAELGLPVARMKPHGALYHAAARDPATARALLEGTRRALGTVTIVGPPSLGALAARLGLPFERECFADRATRPDGSLVPRTEPGALITDPVAAAAHARRHLDFATICVHADTPNAVEMARAVRAALDACGPSEGPG
jgi:UPF0271 protein